MKKLIMATVLSLTILASGSVPAFADSDAAIKYEKENINGGYEVVQENSSTRGVVSEYVYSGGTKAGYWIHGSKKISGVKNVYSKFKAYSPYSEGRASVVNGVGDDDDGGWQPAGTYSVANVKWTFSGICIIGIPIRYPYDTYFIF